MKAVAIVPARGGSKRLPRKNVIDVCGRPMLTYPIEAALTSRMFDEIIVSTDDADIARVARTAGAHVHERPGELGADTATVAEVCADALSALAARRDSPALFCCIYATALFLHADDLLASRALIDAPPAADFVMGVSAFSPHPVQALREKDGYLASMWPEYERLQSQQYPRLVASNGTFYWARSEAFLAAGGFYGPRLKGYEMPRDRAVDIDTREDLEFAERLLASGNLPGGG